MQVPVVDDSVPTCRLGRSIHCERNSKTTDLKVVKRIINKKLIIKTGKYSYKVRWRNGHCQWISEEKLNCPKQLKYFEETRKQIEIINYYNDVLAIRKSKKYGFQRQLRLDKFLGAIGIENILVLETKWHGAEENDFVCWHEAKKKCPQKLLKFCLDYVILNRKRTVYSWGNIRDLPQFGNIVQR